MVFFCCASGSKTLRVVEELRDVVADDLRKAFHPVGTVEVAIIVSPEGHSKK